LAIGKDSKPGDLVREIIRVPRGVVSLGSQKHDQAAGDLSDTLSPDPNGRSRHPLQENLHGFFSWEPFVSVAARSAALDGTGPRLSEAKLNRNPGRQLLRA
jgi:hypothetical protein